MNNKNIGVAEILNSLLRAELSALATYSHVLKKTKVEDAAREVRGIKDEHEAAVHLLTAKLLDLGARPSREASTWKNIELLAAETSGEPLKDPVALKALKEGEEQDILTYESALQTSKNPTINQWIEETLLPQTRAHIPKLDRLLKAA